MSLIRIREPQSLLAALNTGEDRGIVGFFPEGSEALPAFQQFCAEREDLATFVMDPARAQGLLESLGVETTPVVLELQRTRVLQRLAGPRSAADYSLSFGRTVPSHQVVLYTAPGCSWCVRAKAYLRQRGVFFEEIDVAADSEAARRMVERSGRQGVPQIEIDGQVVVGFDRGRIDVLLGIATPVGSP